jgi:hypothetical protein
VPSSRTSFHHWLRVAQDGGKKDNLVSFRTIAYAQASVALTGVAAMFQVLCLSFIYSSFIPDKHHLLGSEADGGDVRARSEV